MATVPDPLLVTWGANIRSHRDAKHLSQAELANLLGADQSAVSRWENGQREPGRVHKAMLAQVLGTHVGVLFPHTTEAVA